MATFVILNIHPSGKETMLDLDRAIVRPSTLAVNKTGAFIMPDNGAGPAFEVLQSFASITKAIGAKFIPPPQDGG